MSYPNPYGGPAPGNVPSYPSSTGYGGGGGPPAPGFNTSGGGYPPQQPGCGSSYPQGPGGGAYPPQQYGGGGAPGYPPQPGGGGYPSQPGAYGQPQQPSLSYPSQQPGQGGYGQPPAPSGHYPGQQPPGQYPSAPGSQGGSYPSGGPGGAPQAPYGGAPSVPTLAYGGGGAQAPGYGGGGQPAGYGGPTSGYGAPTPGYGGPTSGYGGPTSGSGGPTPGCGGPTSGYGGPTPGYGGPTSAYCAPTSGYPASGYGGGAAPTSGYGGPPAPGYGSPASGYGNPSAGGYGGAAGQQQAHNYGGYASGAASTTPIMAHNMYQGTVKPSPTFNPNADCEALKKAMKGLGCDDKTVINVLCYRSNAQRQQIRNTFKTMYGKDLIKELISELRGNFEDLVVALMYTPGEYDARELNYAMAGVGTNESTLIEIMTTRTNAEIRDTKMAYKMMFGKDLERALVDETSGYFKRLLVSLCNAGRDESFNVDPSRAKKSAQDLLQAGVKKWGTDEATFNAVLCAQSHAQLQAVFEEYRKLAGHDIEQAIKGEFSGDIEDGLLAVVKSAKNSGAYFAERCYRSMVGMGTHDRCLIRAVVTRCEKDMVQIKQEFQRMYGKTLDSFISGDCSGKYKDGLMALVRGN